MPIILQKVTTNRENTTHPSKATAKTTETIIAGTEKAIKKPVVKKERK